ncbi:hypothetical protein K523DRAFT_299452 [Schizophyllum commune Tattone D]|nr:hypothetical protein K523DRAFT_299452 [Schizophyllum commune Tattone D]
MVKSPNFVVNEIGSVPQVPLDDFLKCFMPPRRLGRRQISEVYSSLCNSWLESGRISKRVIGGKKTRAIQWGTQHAPYDQKRRIWSDFAQAPKLRGGREKWAYAALADICDQVVTHCQGVRDDLIPTTRLVVNQSKRLSELELNSPPPIEACHDLIDNHGDELNVFDSVCIIQFTKTKDPKATHDNDKQIIWGQYQTMRMDARRRFTFGMTFVDTTVRLWHYNREVLVVSEIFDFNKNCKTLIDVYARLSFATMPELGFDPNMTLIPSLSLPAAESSQKAEQHRYCIAIGETQWIATETMTDVYPHEGFGRCTRIFSAYKEDESVDKTFIIKDCWVEATRSTECETLKRIKTAILAYDWDKKCHPPPDDVSTLISYTSDRIVDPRYGRLSPEERLQFFVPMIDAVKVVVNGREDNTQDIIASGYEFSDSRDMYQVHSYSAMDKDRHLLLWHDIVGYEPYWRMPETMGRFFRPIVPRTHHRLVMEKGVPLTKVGDAEATFSVLSDAAYAVFILHCIGWLHRDISADNILQMPDGRGVLTDLEFAKLYVDPWSQDFRGTPDFIAIEVARRTYLNAQLRVRENPFDADEEPVTIGDVIDWHYRDIHDLESIWWLCLWLLFHHTSDCVPASHDIVQQAEKCAEIFPGYLHVSNERYGILAERGWLGAALRSVPQDWAAVLEGYLTAVRGVLRMGYESDKRGRPIHPGSWVMIHNMCTTGKAIKGKLVWITREEVDRVKELRKAEMEASQRSFGTAPLHQEQPSSSISSADDTTTEDTPASEPRRYSTAKRKKRDEAKLVHDSSSSSDSEDVLPCKRTKCGSPPEGGSEPRSSGRNASHPSGQHTANQLPG